MIQTLTADTAATTTDQSPPPVPQVASTPSTSGPTVCIVQGNGDPQCVVAQRANGRTAATSPENAARAKVLAQRVAQANPEGDR